MKAVVFLALLGVAAARPQLLYPANTPVITLEDVDDDDVKVITTPLTYTYPTTYSTLPLTYAGSPYTHPFGFPVVANPVAAKADSATRPKRSADAEPEPEADPWTIYSTGHTSYPIAGTTTWSYPTYPTVSTYGAFPNVPLTYGNWPYGNVVKAA